VNFHIVDFHIVVFHDVVVTDTIYLHDVSLRYACVESAHGMEGGEPG
jgi:hypothetical protein